MSVDPGNPCNHKVILWDGLGRIISREMAWFCCEWAIGVARRKRGHPDNPAGGDRETLAGSSEPNQSFVKALSHSLDCSPSEVSKGLLGNPFR